MLLVGLVDSWDVMEPVSRSCKYVKVGWRSMTKNKDRLHAYK